MDTHHSPSVAPALRTAIIGEGNVGTHLVKAIPDSTLFNSRRIDELDSGFNFILIAVSDQAIGTVAEKISYLLPHYEGIVCHTSGSVDMEIFSSYFKNYGVFYPLQTFSKEIAIANYSEIPVFLEGNSNETLKKIEELANSVFHSIYHFSSNKRQCLHVASVFACNFVNAMYTVASDLLKESDIPENVLKPLIAQTALKVMTTSPKDCQTGPAIRGDEAIINAHLHSLGEDSEKAKIYKIITEYITSYYATPCK